jgi:putative DNA primase/helicase
VRNDLPYIGSNPRLCTQFTEYLVSATTEQRIRSVSKVGWSGSTLVRPDRAVSPDRQEGDGVSADRERRSLGTRGSLEEWRESVGRMCSGNSRLLFAASCAFAGPLLGLIDAQFGGFHLNGLTSSEKTTALLC